MMKYPITRGTLAALVAGLIVNVLLPNASDARIGERRESLERRLLEAGGIIYRDDVVEESRRKGMPYARYLEILPSSADVRIYFKTSDGRRASSSELKENRISAGWDVHVVYVGGKSVLEVYKRSQSMTEYEVNHLLALHANGGHWKLVAEEDLAEEVTAFGFEMVRSDGHVRAKKLGGNAVMFFDTEADKKLAEMNSADQEEKAPTSVKGF